MKAIIRVPMKESFGYIEFEIEHENLLEGDVVEIYKRTLAASKEGTNNNDF